MRGVRSVDEVGADERAGSLAKRSIKKSSKLWALDLAVRCMDLTTLEGSDTPGKVTALCAKAIRPKPGDATIPSVAALCVYPARVADEITRGRRRQTQYGMHTRTALMCSSIWPAMRAASPRLPP